MPCAGLMEAFLTGGIPPHIDDGCPADKVYQATFRRVMVQNKKFYTRFPGDVQVVKDIVNYLASQKEGGVATPAGNMLRPRTLQLLGLQCALRPCLQHVGSCAVEKCCDRRAACVAIELHHIGTGVQAASALLNR